MVENGKAHTLAPEKSDALHETVPDVYRSLHFRSIQDPYTSVRGNTLASQYSTLRADDVDTMLSGGLERFYKKYDHLSRKINLALPTPEVRFENLSFAVDIPLPPAMAAAKERASVIMSNSEASEHSGAPSMDNGEAKHQHTVGAYMRRLLTPWKQPETYRKKVLHPMSGIIKPGTMTLILANPGAGKSTFLKALAGKLQNSKKTHLGGEVLYSGLKGSEIDLIKVIGLVDQQDNHVPTLTVRETFQFADRCVNGMPQHQPEEMREVAALRTDLFLHILGLNGCADTVVGDALLRGVSGGERKRVTIGEMLVGGQSLFLCDEISTGLDSAATYDIMASLRTWCGTLGGSAVVALLQPAPEVVELFDDILMIHEGHMVYHGPRVEILSYFHNLGFQCPPRTDPADFLIEVTSGRGEGYANGMVPHEELPVTPEDFCQKFLESPMYKATYVDLNRGAHGNEFLNAEDFRKVKSVATLAKSKGRSEFGLGFFRGTKLLLERQKTIWLRDRPLLWGKLFEALIVGLVLGVLYYDVDPKYYLRTLFFSVSVFQRQAWQQITIAFQLRKVFYKQRSRNFFRTSSYAIAESVVQIPVNISVAVILSTIFYWLSGLTANFWHYLIFLFIIFSFQHAIGAYMTLLSSISSSITIAQALAGLSVSFFLLFSGNIILAELIPTYWIWMYWFNPIAWALRSVMLLEFHSSKYTKVETETYLQRFSISQGEEFIWIGIAVLLTYYLLFTSLNGIALHYIRYETYSGVTPVALTSPGDKKSSSKTVHEGDVYVEVATPTPEYDLQSPRGAPPSTTSQVGNTGLPFIPANLCIQDLSYYVTLPSGEEKQLLHEITAHFEPGRIVALMGSSGAGKTTLMDVIAGRKTGGRMTGSIIVNGEPKNPKNFSRIAAYCEQMDIHSDAASIREALIFAANLRLPHTFTLEQRMNLVEETLDLLELRGIQHELIVHLSVEQRKRVTIGVEVVANPSILFLDEPTSGLDARSALIVMRGVRSISRTGRTVVCTIHQPSISIFELFDGLLLLQRGGFTAYFGDLGKDSVEMLEYFASIPGTDEIRPQYNPATYMLEVIGAGIGRDVKDYSMEYRNSTLCQENRAKTLELSALSSKFVAFSTQNYKPIPTSFTNQLSELATKQRLTYWRNPQYNFMRLFLYPIFALIFGTAFFQLETNSVKKINSHVGLAYNLQDFIGVMNLMTVLEISCAERAVYYRERMSNYYSPLPYSLSLFFAEIPYLAVIAILFVTSAYWLIGVNNSFFAYLLFMLVFFLYTSVCTFIGQWMSALTPNAKVANVAVGALSCIFNLFSGYLLPRPQMKGYYKWFSYVVPSSYSLASLVTVELGDCSDLLKTGCNVLNDPELRKSADGQTSMTVESFVAKEYDFQPDMLMENIIILGGFWIAIQISIYLTLKYVSHLKR